MILDVGLLVQSGLKNYALEVLPLDTEGSVRYNTFRN